MDKELKEKWVAALRSGEYRQAKGWLHREGGHCCIGVLELVANKGHGGYALAFNECGKDISYQLQNMNDGTGADARQHTFPEIADYIEANL